jgi:hypothetical protein
VSTTKKKAVKVAEIEKPSKTARAAPVKEKKRARG